MPDFLLNKVPTVKLKGEWKGNPAEMRYKKDNRVPRYDHPAYQAAFRELNELLAAEFNGHPQIEFMDTMMYGFWGEGHTWPYEGNPFPSQLVAEQTWASMFEVQLEQWAKVPLATNTQPDSATWAMPTCSIARCAAATGCARTRFSSRTLRSKR